MNNNTIERLNDLLNCKVLNYDKAKEFKQIALSYCLENNTNKISVKWLRGFYNPQNESRLKNHFARRLKTILKANNLSVCRELIAFTYTHLYKRERTSRTEQRFKAVKYIVVRSNNPK